jgi:hypothetical protein
MNWRRWLTSPPPTTGWVLDTGEALVVHRAATGIHCATEDLPAGGFHVGPVGLQSVDMDAVGAVLARLKGAAEGAGTGAVIVPSSWLRSFLVEIDRVPRKEQELHDVVRWKLKRLLPVSPNEVRLSVVRLADGDGRNRLLAMVGIERAMAAIESLFTSVGIEVGLLTTRLFALMTETDGGDRPQLIIQHEESLLSLILIVDSVPKLLRTKPLASTAAGEKAVVREIGLSLGFVRETLGIEGDIDVRWVSEDAETDAAVRKWLAEQSGLQPAPERPRPPCGPSTVVQRLGSARLAPAIAVVTGAVQ